MSEFYEEDFKPDEPLNLLGIDFNEAFRIHSIPENAHYFRTVKEQNTVRTVFFDENRKRIK